MTYSAETLPRILVSPEHGNSGLAVWEKDGFLLPVCGNCGDFCVSEYTNYRCAECDLSYNVKFEHTEARVVRSKHGSPPDENAAEIVASWLDIPVERVDIYVKHV